MPSSNEVLRDSLENYWEYSATFERNNATLLMMTTALGLTDEQVDEFFILGATL